MKENLDDIDNELLVKYLLGEATPAEIIRVREWLAASDDNARYYEQFILIWDESKQLAQGPVVDEQAAWRRFRERTNQKNRLQVVQAPVNNRFRLMRVAAVFIFAVAGAALVYALLFRQPVEMLVVRSHKSLIRDTLPDGSVVAMNKNAVIRYPNRFTGNRRSVTLEGEAFFSVTPDKTKPFVIQVNELRVEVVGTSFNIKSDAGKTEVVVESGVVKVVKDKQTLQLRPGQRVLVDKADSVLTRQAATDNIYHYYRPRTFNCENTPLWKLVQALNEAYGVEIVIARDELRSMPLTTVFDNEPLDHILAIISQTFNTKVEKRDGQIILL